MAQGGPSASFEFFPPKDAEGRAGLLDTVKALAPLNPYFVSVTFGAGGTTREGTFEVVTAIQKQTPLKAAAHLTCVGYSQEEINAIARGYWEAGVRRIVALRGDMPGMQTPYQPVAGGYAYTSDLVEGLKKVAPFDISVAGYPEKHPEAPDMDADLVALKKKVDAGADRVLTQFFMEPEAFLRFRDKAVALGVRVPVVPGIMPIANFKRNAGFARKCGSVIPQWMADAFEGLEPDTEAHFKTAEKIAVDLCQRLMTEGVDTFHFYTLNRSDLTAAVCKAVGVREKVYA